MPSRSLSSTEGPARRRPLRLLATFSSPRGRWSDRGLRDLPRASFRNWASPDDLDAKRAAAASGRSEADGQSEADSLDVHSGDLYGRIGGDRHALFGWR